MPDEQYTRCPGCRTVFRVTTQQLGLRGGQVRCGQCRTVFDGVAELVTFTPRSATDDDIDFDDNAAPGPPTVTLRDGRAREPSTAADGAAGMQSALPDAHGPEPAALAGPAPPGAEEASVAPGAETDAGASTAAPEAADERDPAAGAPAEPAPAMEPAAVAGTSGQRVRSRLAPFAYALAIVLLAFALVGQATFHFRDAIAARFPAARPALASLCTELGCAIGPPHEIADLVIQASDLQADPAHQGLLILTATLRNRGPVVRAYPHLELALTDAQDQVVVRRVLAPSDYVGGTTDIAQGIPANGEVAIKVFIDASATTQAGYRLYLFYG